MIASYLLDSTIKNDVQVVMNIHGVDLGNGVETLSLFTAEDIERVVELHFYHEINKKNPRRVRKDGII